MKFPAQPKSKPAACNSLLCPSHTYYGGSPNSCNPYYFSQGGLKVMGLSERADFGCKILQQNH